MRTICGPVAEGIAISTLLMACVRTNARQVFSGSQHRLPLQDQVRLGWIVIDEANDIAHQRMVLLKLPQQRQPCRAGAVDERPRPLAFARPRGIRAR